MGTLKAIIWHQGETDCTEKGSVNYQAKLSKVVEGFRAELHQPELLFVAGKLPEFQKQQPNKDKVMEYNPYVDQINTAITSLKGIQQNYTYIEALDTDHGGDHLHFNTVSARLMGKRYAMAFIEWLKKK